MHTGFLVNKEEKMSKSLGNFLTLHEALQKYSAETLRFYFLSAHYRSPLDLSDEILEASKKGIEKIKDWLAYLELIINQNFEPEDTATLDLETFDNYIAKAMTDDINVPSAMSSLFTLINTTNTVIAAKKLGSTEAKKLKDWTTKIDKIFGIVPELAMIPEEINRLNEKRKDKKREKDYTGADTIREEINEKGYEINDTPIGSILSKK